MRPGFLAYGGDLGLGIVGKRPAFLPAAQFILGRLVEPKKWEPLFLPASSACPSGFPRCDVGGLLPTWYPHPAICPLWAFPAATCEEPEPTSPKRSLRLRPCKRGREGEYGGDLRRGDKICCWEGSTGYRAYEGGTSPLAGEDGREETDFVVGACGPTPPQPSPSRGGCSLANGSSRTRQRWRWSRRSAGYWIPGLRPG